MTPGQIRKASVAGGVLLTVALVLLAMTFSQALWTLSLVRNGLTAQGEVYRLVYKRARRTGGYHAIVDFQDHNGNGHLFMDGWSSPPSLYETGQKVTVLYNKYKPEMALIDRGIFKWFDVIAMAAADAWMFFYGVRLIRRSREKTA